MRSVTAWHSEQQWGPPAQPLLLRKCVHPPPSCTDKNLFYFSAQFGSDRQSSCVDTKRLVN